MTTFGTIVLSAIAPSLTNPRKHFDDAKLRELADSIAASGVHQAVLLRPLPASRIADTAQLSPRPEFELVTGERRYRASLLAKATTIPAMIRELSDDQVLEIQIIENLQRDDLTVLEEADGYQALMDHSQLTADQVAAKIGKSRSYVFGRLKLLDMGQDCRDALRTGLIDASKALLLARIPSTSLQAKALKEILRVNHPEGVMNHRLAHEWIKSRYMLKIEQAPFDHTDTSLAPRACTICPTRTGADADLFMDVMGADMCTNPDCYAGKVQQHHSRRRAELEAKGHQIIDGKDAEELLPYPNSAPEGYARLDDAADSPTDKPLRQELAKLIDKGDVVPVMIVNPHAEGELIACVAEDDVASLLARAGRKKAADAAKAEQAKEDQKDADKRERNLRLEYETTWRLRVLDAVHAELVQNPSEALDRALTQEIGAQLIHAQLDRDVARHLCQKLGLTAEDHDQALNEWLVNPAPLTQHDALALLLAARGSGFLPYLLHRDTGERELKPLAVTAAAIGVDMDAVKAAVQAEMRERATPSKPLAPAAQADGARGKAKSKKTGPAGARAPSGRISEAEAMSGIAAAMQSDEDGADYRAVAEPQTTAMPERAIGQQESSVKRSDALLEDAAELVKETQAVSVRQLKEALSIGTDRAMRIIDQLERDGVVSACDGNGGRKVLVAA